MMVAHETTIRVRYAEVDQMGVVHHSRYFIYMELARTEALRATGLTYRDVEAAGRYLVITKAMCRFRAPARYDDELLIATTVERATTTRIDHCYKITRKEDGVLVATAETTLACVDADGNLSMIPDEVISRLE